MNNQTPKKKPICDLNKLSRERDRLRQQSPEFIKRMQELNAEAPPDLWKKQKQIFIINKFKKIFGLDWYSYTDQKNSSGIGFRWRTFIDTPPKLIHRDDRNYFSGFAIEFIFLSHHFHFIKNIKRQKYRNADEYSICLKKQRSSAHVTIST